MYNREVKVDVKNTEKIFCLVKKKEEDVRDKIITVNV